MVCKLMRINGVPDAMVIGLLMQDLEIEMLARKEAQAGFGNLVVHYRIELIALQPALGLMPDFADNISFRINCTHSVAKFLPKGIIVDFGGYIQAPAVNTNFDPILGYLQQKFTHCRCVRVELWQGGQIPPAAITDGCDAVFVSKCLEFLRARVRAPVLLSGQSLRIKEEPVLIRRT